MPQANTSVGLGLYGVFGSSDKRRLGTIKVSETDKHTQHGLLGLSDGREPPSHLRASQLSMTRSIPSFLLAACETPVPGRRATRLADGMRKTSAKEVDGDVGSARFFGLRPPQRSARGKEFLRVPSVEDDRRPRRDARTYYGSDSDDRRGSIKAKRRPGPSRTTSYKKRMSESTASLLLAFILRLWKLSKGVVGAPFAVSLKTLLVFLRTWSFFLKVWLWVVWVAVRVVKELLVLLGSVSSEDTAATVSAKVPARDCACEECTSDPHGSTFETLADSEDSDENENAFQLERSSNYTNLSSQSFILPPAPPVPRLVVAHDSPIPSVTSQSKTLLAPEPALQTQRRGRQMPDAVSTPANKTKSILWSANRNDKTGLNQRGRSISPYIILDGTHRSPSPDPFYVPQAPPQLSIAHPSGHLSSDAIPTSLSTTSQTQFKSLQVDEETLAALQAASERINIILEENRRRVDAGEDPSSARREARRKRNEELDVVRARLLFVQ